MDFLAFDVIVQPLTQTISIYSTNFPIFTYTAIAMDYWSSCADIRFFSKIKNKSSASNLSSELYLVLVASK